MFEQCLGDLRFLVFLNRLWIEREIILQKFKKNSRLQIRHLLPAIF